MGALATNQILQAALVTTVFVFHLFTFYDLSLAFIGNMVLFETTVYGIYFIITIGYVIAVVTDGNFTPPMEAMTKLYGAILFNVLGMLSFRLYLENMEREGISTNHHIFGLIKSVCSLVVCILYYVEMFHA